MEDDLFMREDLPSEAVFDRDALTIGTEVMVTDGVPGYRRTNGDAVKAVVTKKARVWITVQEVSDRAYPRAWRLRLDDQTDGGDTNYVTRFYTPDQWLIKQALFQANRYLDSQRIQVSYDSVWRKGQRIIQLARIIRSAQQG